MAEQTQAREAVPARTRPMSSDRLRGRSVTRVASQVVQDAASILEEEIAAGIAAAQKMEQRFINVRELRTKDPDALMNRLRRDVHDIVDIILDLVSVAVNTAATLSVNGLSIRGRLPKAALPAAPATLALPNPLAPGEHGEIQLSLDNDGEEPTQPLGFCCSDLVSPTGGRISASHVKFNPGHLVIQPRTSERISLAIHVPKEAAPGTYTGVFEATGMNGVRAVLMLEVRDKASEHKTAPAKA